MAALPALHNAVSSCHVEAVQNLLNAGMDPNAVDHKGRTALAHVPSTAQPQALHDLLRVLLGGGANPHACDKMGNTALFYALDRGERTTQDSLLVACRTLLDAGVAIDQVGVDVDLPPGHPHGETRPLDLALVKQCLRVVKLLLSRGASPLAPPTPTYGWTALHFAAAHPEFAEQFIRQGADPFAVSVDGDTPLGLMTDSVKARVQQALVERERNVLQATLQPEDVTSADVVQDGTALRARVRL